MGKVKISGQENNQNIQTGASAPVIPAQELKVKKSIPTWLVVVLIVVAFLFKDELMVKSGFGPEQAQVAVVQAAEVVQENAPTVHMRTSQPDQVEQEKKKVKIEDVYKAVLAVKVLLTDIKDYSFRDRLKDTGYLFVLAIIGYILATAVYYGAWLLIDKFTPNIDIMGEIKNGNIAVSLIVVVPYIGIISYFATLLG